MTRGFDCQKTRRTNVSTILEIFLHLSLFLEVAGLASVVQHSNPWEDRFENTLSGLPLLLLMRKMTVEVSVSVLSIL